MMTAGTLLTLDQFSELPEINERTGETYELAHGELIVMPSQPAIHEKAKNQVARVLWAFLASSGLGGEVRVESGFTLNEESWRRPDVSFLNAARSRNQDLSEPYTSGPDLAIEVVSRSESKADLAKKVDHFLASGTRRMWALYPDTRQAHVHEVGKKVVKLEADGRLEDAELLPGFSISVRDLFPG